VGGSLFQRAVLTAESDKLRIARFCMLFARVCCHISFKFAMKIPPHLKCVATLPCEIPMSKLACRDIDISQDEELEVRRFVRHSLYPTTDSCLTHIRSVGSVAYTIRLVTPECTRGVIDSLYHSRHNGRDR